jgi:hypothetical protein
MHFSGVKISIASNISTAFFSDCNTFATPTDSTYLMMESFSAKSDGVSARFCDRVCFTGLLSDLLHCTRSA